MPTRHLTVLNSLACLFLVAACGGGGGGGAEDGPDPDIPITTTVYTVGFSASQIIDGAAAPDTITATANLSVARGDGTFASGTVTVNGVAATSVTINVGYAGESGPIAVVLTNSGGGSWAVPAGTEIDDQEFFRLDAAGYYVAIETPQGRLRGQIVPPNWVGTIVPLDDEQVVPAAMSTGSAIAGFTLDPRTGRLRLRITLTGVPAATSAGLRSAISGARGDVVIPLEQSTSDPNVWGTRDINDPNADDILTPAGLDLLLSGELYFSVETAANPTGELRGQIFDETVTVTETVLTAGEVVTSGAPVDTGAEGTATLTWNGAVNRLGVAVNTDINNAVSVAVYQGAPGENGALVLTLSADVMLTGNWVVRPTEVATEIAEALEAGNLYVSIVTVANPEGELRGQLSLDPPM